MQTECGNGTPKGLTGHFQFQSNSGHSRPVMFFLVLLLPNALAVSVLELDRSCDGNCIQEMERLIEATPSSSGLNVNPFLYSTERNFMRHFFTRVCDAYRGVDECLVRCESKSKSVADLKVAYSGLQFVCKERREEFFNSLPCLSENESKGVFKCSAQINQSQATTLLFTNSIINREFHSMQMRFGVLCRDLSAVVRCMIPVIRESCGEKAADLLLRFIGLEFSSFELLYRQLQFDAPLPVSCRTLIKQALASEKPQKPKTTKFYKFYLNGSDLTPQHYFLSISPLLLLLLIVHFVY